MMKIVRKSDSPASTWLGGSCGVPSAWRRNDITMMMRVKQVSDITSADANDSAVTSRKIFTAAEPPPAERHLGAGCARPGSARRLRPREPVRSTNPPRQPERQLAAQLLVLEAVLEDVLEARRGRRHSPAAAALEPRAS